MRFRTERLPPYILVIVALVAIAVITVALTVRVRYYTTNYTAKYEAARLTQRLMERVKAERQFRGTVIDAVNDPNQTGLIGLPQSPITTEYGDLSAKLTALNPNFAAVVVDLLTRTGAQPGDAVAVSLSGSFPSLNLAVLAALQIMRLEPVIITSVGASMWGANDPSFTYLDMEKTLYEQGEIKFCTDHASIGGTDDIGRALSPEGRDLITGAIRRCGVPLIETSDLEASVQKRVELYEARKTTAGYRCFLNVGGGAAALGGSDIPSGVVEPNQFILNRGVVGVFLRRGITVINLTDISRLARHYDLPLSPTPLPAAGKGKIFYEGRYSTALAAAGAAFMLIVILLILRIDVDHYLRALVKTRRDQA